METAWRPCADYVEAAVGGHQMVRVAARHTCADSTRSAPEYSLRVYRDFVALPEELQHSGPKVL